MSVRIISALGVSYYAPIMLDPVRRPAVQVLQDITRLGADGHEYRLESARSEPVAISMLFTCTEANRVALRTALEKLQGTIVSYVTHLGETITNMAVLSARCTSESMSLKSIGAVNHTDGTAATDHDRTLTMEFIIQSRVKLV